MFSRATTASINCSVSGPTGSLLAASLDAPFPCSRGFRPLPSGRDSGISAILSASPRVAKFKRQSFLRVRAFGLVARPTMPSADFCHLIAPPLGVASTRQDGRSPRLLPAASTSKLSVQVLDFEEYCLLIQLCRLICGFCSSGQRFAHSFLRIPPRDGHPCCSANDSPCWVRRGLSPPNERALPGAQYKSRVRRPAFRCGEHLRER